VARAKRNKSYRLAKLHDRRSRDLPLNAEVAAVEVDDPLALEPGEKIVALRSIRNDPLAGFIRTARSTRRNTRAGVPERLGEGRAWPAGGRSDARICRRRPITEGQRKAVLRLSCAERELGADGAALVHEVLVMGLSMEQVGQRRNLQSQRWNDYFSRRFRECLDRLALIYGFANVNSAENALRR